MVLSMCIIGTLDIFTVLVHFYLLKYSWYKIYITGVQGFPGGASNKEFVYQCRRCKTMGLIPGSGRSPGVENGNPLQYSCLEKFHGQRSLAGCGPWGYKESDMTE